MKLNRAEKIMLHNPVRIIAQRKIIDWMKAARTLPSDARVLEIGCGRGAGAGLLKREFGLTRLMAMDLDLAQIRTAKRYLAEGGNGDVNLCVGDTEYLPFGSATLDAVFGFGVLHHLPDWRKGLNETARVLKPGGVFYMEDYYPGTYANIFSKYLLKHPRTNRFKSPEFNEAIRQAGFVPERKWEHRHFGIFAVCVKDSGACR